MKKLFLTLFLTVMATAMMYAQQIVVVSATGDTDVFQTLPDAIQGATPGSVIYLPGGGFPISDDVKITKKLTIVGIGHKSNNDNVDGITTISGNLWFNEGSSGSAVLGCYITGNVNIGDGGVNVNDVLIRYCNLNSVQVLNSTCMETIVNQNYIRGGSYFCSSNAKISNNIIDVIGNLGSGEIVNNICCVETGGPSWYRTVLSRVYNTIITGNIFRGPNNVIIDGSDCQISGNFVFGTTWGDDPIIIEGNAQDVFVDVNGWMNSPYSNFHFTEAYKQYENQVGIYAGTGFNDNQLAPVPYIVSKHVDEQTDAQGKLNVKIRVKAGQ